MADRGTSWLHARRWAKRCLWWAVVVSAACQGREVPILEVDGGPAPVIDGGGADPVDGGEASDAGLPPGDGPTRRRDGGAPRLDGGADGGRDGGPGLPPQVIVVEIDTFEPRRGPTQGGTEVSISGRGFVPGTTVTIGGRALVGLSIAGERRISGKTPPGSAGVEPILLENEATRVEIAGGFIYDEPVALDGITPARGPAPGGTVVTVTGAGFVPGTTVLIGPRPAYGIRIESLSRIQAVTPPGAEGPAPVTVVSRGGVATREGAFLYLPALAIGAVDPPVGPVAGGNRVRITGQGFDSSAEAFFGALRAERVSSPSSTSLEVVVPGAAGPGPVDVAVRTQDQAAGLPAAYAYYLEGGDLSIRGVVPGRGPTSGGTQVWIVGAALDRGVAEVRFGGTPAPLFAVEGPGVLRATTPAGVPGSADVAVWALGSSATLPGGFVYESGLALTGATPAAGPAAGGTEVELTGDGFGPRAEVFFGPLAAPVVRSLDARTLRARTPPAAAGPVDLVVRQGGSVAMLPSGFTYYDQPLLYRVTPGRGAVAGGTYVTLTGSGFTAASRPFFNGAPAVDVSLVNAGTITARTPPGTVGPAVVAVESDYDSTSMAGAYEYFDPRSRYGGTSGGPIEGALNLTVLDGWTGRRLPGAFATLLSTGPTRYQGLTDEHGQLVFSGPDLRGRQTLTAAREGYSATSVLAFDAENLTVFLSPLSVSLGPGTPGPPVPTVRGKVKNAFKPIPPPPAGYRKAVLVTTTASSRWQALYVSTDYLDVLLEDGQEDQPYEVKTRYGDVAVYALAGHLSESATHFVPYVMGIHRYLSIILGTPVVEGIDVTLDADLNATLDARLLHAPPLSTDGPTVYRMRVFLDLGIDGVVTFFQLPESTGEPRLVQEHLPVITGSIAASSFTIVAGAYRLIEGQYETLPRTEVVKEGVTQVHGPLDLGPLMGIAQALRPAEAGYLEDQRFVWGIDEPPHPSFFLIYLPQQIGTYSAAIWEVIVPGHLREIRAPDLAALAGLAGIPAAATPDWYLTAAETREFSIDAFDYRDFYGSRWLSSSSTRYTFLTR